VLKFDPFDLAIAVGWLLKASMVGDYSQAKALPNVVSASDGGDLDRRSLLGGVVVGLSSSFSAPGENLGLALPDRATAMLKLRSLLGGVVLGALILFS
jgi:hypothetical protein